MGTQATPKSSASVLAGPLREIEAELPRVEDKRGEVRSLEDFMERRGTDKPTG